MKLSKTLYGENSDISDLMLDFITNAAADFANTASSLSLDLKIALMQKSNAVILLKIKKTSPKNNSKILIGFKGKFYSLTCNTNNAVLITSITETTNVHPALYLKVINEINHAFP